MVRRVLVVDDHDDVRAAIVTLLTAEGFAVVGEAANAEQALAVAKCERPGVVLLDIRLPGPDGFSVARDLSCLSPAPLVVLMSSREAWVYGRELERSAAEGFITKSDLSGASLRRVLGEGVA